MASRRTARLLGSITDVDPSRVVHHAERSGQVDVILAHGPTAALEAARLGGHRQAAEVLRVVLDYRELLGPREVADLLTRRAYSLYLVNQYEDALESAEAGVVAAEQAEDTIVLADALQVLARVVLFARGPMRSRLAAARAVDILEPAGDGGRLAAALTESARGYSNLAGYRSCQLAGGTGVCAPAAVSSEWLGAMSGLGLVGDGRQRAHADVCDLEWVIWRRSSCNRGEGPGAKLDAA